MMPAARDSVVNNNQPNTEPGDPHGEPMRFYPGSGCYAAERLPPPAVDYLEAVGHHGALAVGHGVLTRLAHSHSGNGLAASHEPAHS